MEKPRSIDDFAPKARFQFPDGSQLTVGTKRDGDDYLAYGVHVVFVEEAKDEPSMNILMPPHAIDILVEALQGAANQARFIMGHKVVDYPAIPKKAKAKKPAKPSARPKS